MNNLKLTEQERDLIESIRNYKRSYPNGSDEQEYLIRTILDEMLYG